MRRIFFQFVYLAFFLLIAFSCKKETNASTPVTPTYPGWTNYNDGNSGLVTNYLWGSIVIDSAGNIWTGSLNNGIAQFNGKSWIPYPIASAYYIGTVYCITIDPHDTIWAFADAGVLKFNGTNWLAYNDLNGGLPGNIGGQIAFDPKGTMWVGPSVLNGNTWTTYTSTNSGIAYNGIGSLTLSIDKQGNKWFGTTEGLSKFNDTTWTNYTVSNSGLVNNNISCIAFDANNNKWFGTIGGGVSKFDGSKWTTYKKTNSGLANDTIGCITFDKQGFTWFGYEFGSGVSKFDGTNWTSYTTANSGLSDNGVIAIAIDAQGNKWFGTYGGGVCEFKN